MKITIKNVITTLLFQILAILCGLIIPKLIISSYGSNVNGLVVSITQFLTYITLLDAGFGAVIKSLLYKPVSTNNKKNIEKILSASEKIFKKITYAFIVYIIILCIIFPYFTSNEFDRFYTMSLIIIISINTFSEYFFGMTHRLYLQSIGKLYVISIIQIITLLLNTALVIILIKLGTSIHIVKLVSALVLITRPIIIKLYVKRKYDLNLKNNNNYVIKQKWNALIQHIAYVVHNNIDVVLITIFLDIKEVSVYSIYLLIVNSIKNVVSSFLGGVDARFGNMIATNDYDRLTSRFKIYINTYNTITTILYVSTLFLILPFVKLYTNGISDIDYIRPLFSYLFVFSGFILMIKQPYYDLVKVVGHFKQTQKGAIIEVILNLIISIVLILKYGLVGVVIGTVISSLVRMIEIMYYVSKNILKISFIYTLKRLFAIIVEIIIIYFIIKYIGNYNINNYFDFIVYALIVTFISSIVVIGINLLVNRKNNYFLN